MRERDFLTGVGEVFEVGEGVGVGSVFAKGFGKVTFLFKNWEIAAFFPRVPVFA